MTRSIGKSAAKRRSTNVGTVLLVIGGIGLLTSGATSGVWVVPLVLMALGMHLLRGREPSSAEPAQTVAPSPEPQGGSRDLSHIEKPTWDTLLNELKQGQES